MPEVADCSPSGSDFRGGESLGRPAVRRRDPDGWRGFVAYSPREPAGLLRYTHLVSAADLSPRDADAGHPAWASSVGEDPGVTVRGFALEPDS